MNNIDGACAYSLCPPYQFSDPAWPEGPSAEVVVWSGSSVWGWFVSKVSLVCSPTGTDTGPGSGSRWAVDWTASASGLGDWGLVGESLWRMVWAQGPCHRGDGLCL